MSREPLLAMYFPAQGPAWLFKQTFPRMLTAEAISACSHCCCWSLLIRPCGAWWRCYWRYSGNSCL